ncbi:putative RNA-binding protein (Jag domain) [Campylobacter pinnipediorum subsp. caledonicus]|uniref:Putative RNA-binding protein (Jag domain) n=1 Tax=Campylobacter pinnipediorum subsp. caledonicus TaxID=1874362 RepID=A0A1S6U738_9BACT|nr:Jag N-terminal domain-containing protein [Campylobacter pinnipediorum]AQW85959.1 putative RNA-binding protein (Jag domain) [Campylobacter pinnipediorum subsp. caledonicus]AQW87566.1 putative RNA-binding protein (Jag domain) [Campylobacter pinnipediorum subsp. caledonicus]
MRIEAQNLQEAFQKAAEKLNCSVTELDIKVIQHPNNGFLGFFKKNAIIEANNEKTINTPKPKNEQKDSSDKNKKRNKNKKSQNDKKTEPTNIEKQNEPKQDYIIKRLDKEENDKKKQEKAKQENTQNHIESKQNKPQQNIDFDKILPEIKTGLVKLFASSFFKIDKIEVSKYSDDCVLIELDGDDAALLIGKEGYRYKAISYLIHNWLNLKYNLSIRLEIAEFLKNQENTMDQYLSNIIQRIQTNGKAQTKPLDGVLVKIAVSKLREKFPDKYVGIKTNGNDKFVIVNDFIKK